MRYDLCTCIYISAYVVVLDEPFATPVTDATLHCACTSDSTVHVQCMKFPPPPPPPPILKCVTYNTRASMYYNSRESYIVLTEFYAIKPNNTFAPLWQKWKKRGGGGGGGGGGGQKPPCPSVSAT